MKLHIYMLLHNRRMHMKALKTPDPSHKYHPAGSSLNLDFLNISVNSD